LPRPGNIGGGGFLVLWRPDTATAGRPAGGGRRRVERGRAVRSFPGRSAPGCPADLFLGCRWIGGSLKATRSLLSTGVLARGAGWCWPSGRLRTPAARRRDRPCDSPALAKGWNRGSAHELGGLPWKAAAHGSSRTPPPSPAVSFNARRSAYAPGDRLRQAPCWPPPSAASPRRGRGFLTPGPVGGTPLVALIA